MRNLLHTPSGYVKIVCKAFPVWTIYDVKSSTWYVICNITEFKFPRSVRITVDKTIHTQWRLSKRSAEERLYGERSETFQAHI